MQYWWQVMLHHSLHRLVHAIPIEMCCTPCTMLHFINIYWHELVYYSNNESYSYNWYCIKNICKSWFKQYIYKIVIVTCCCLAAAGNAMTLRDIWNFDWLRQCVRSRWLVSGHVIKVNCIDVWSQKTLCDRLQWSWSVVWVTVVLNHPCNPHWIW